jgi:multidrug efflux pump subunit AcrB
VIHRFTEELEHGLSLEKATTTTLATTGSALLGSALTTALGFGVLLFSPLIPFRQFGLVTAITILFALIVAVVVVPPLMVVWAAYHEWRRREIAEAERQLEPVPQDDELQSAAADTSGDVVVDPEVDGHTDTPAEAEPVQPADENDDLGEFAVEAVETPEATNEAAAVDSQPPSDDSADTDSRQATPANDDA